MNYPQTHIATDSRTPNGSGSFEIYRCYACRSIYQMITSEVKRLRKSPSRCSKEGFHVQEYVCSRNCADERQPSLLKTFKVPIYSLINFGKASTAIKNTPAHKFIRGVGDTGGILVFKCRSCKKKHSYDMITVKGLRSHQPKGCSERGPHWREYFCSDACMSAHGQLYKLGFKREPERSPPVVPSFKQLQDEIKTRTRIKHELKIKRFLEVDFKGRIVVKEIKESAQWLADNKTDKYTQKQLIEILKR